MKVGIMGYGKAFVCTHLTLGMCSCTCTLAVTNGFRSSSTKKRKLCSKTNVGSRNKKLKNDDHDEVWKIKKVLEKSDVGSMSRLILRREMAEVYVLPVLGDDADQIDSGVSVQIWDVDTNSMHSLVFKRWVSSRSFVFIGNWVSDFVARRGLRKGDEIGLQWNPFKNGFEFSVLQVNYMG